MIRGRAPLLRRDDLEPRLGDLGCAVARTRRQDGRGGGCYDNQDVPEMQPVDIFVTRPDW